MSDCVFCGIVNKRCPGSVFYEDNVVIGLMTIGPVTTGHAMIIPKKHVAYLQEMDEETGRHLWTITHRTAAAIRECGVKCEGVNLFLADGEATFQEVLHVPCIFFLDMKAIHLRLMQTGVSNHHVRN